MSAVIILSQYENIERIQALAGRCAKAGYAVFIAPSLYDIPETNWLWKRIAEIEKPLIVWSALHPRPAKWLLKKHGIEASTYRYDAFDSESACFTALQEQAPQTQAAESTVIELTPQGVKFAQRWYPVVDKDRCNNCGQCLQFCLFGVHSQDNEGVIGVTHPDLCKTGCPACSRICPQGAIMFPMYAKDEAIAGAPGLFMSPDIAARRMFYAKTKKPCPACGVVPVGSAPTSGDKCPECGSAKVQTVSPIKDEIDALIDALDSKL
jgi:Pyruvate/2-oxoacid:ferredoxin oxidoreductase delta subunit